MAVRDGKSNIQLQLSSAAASGNIVVQKV